MTDNILSRYGMGYDPYAWRSNMDAQPAAPQNVLSQGPAPTGRDKVFDTIYNALGGNPESRPTAEKWTNLVSMQTPIGGLDLSPFTAAYDGGRHLAQTGQPGPLAMALMPGAKRVEAAAKAAGGAVRGVTRDASPPPLVVEAVEGASRRNPSQGPSEMRSEHWPHSWFADHRSGKPVPLPRGQWDKDTIERARLHVREMEATARVNAIVEPLMWENGKFRSRVEAERLAMQNPETKNLLDDAYGHKTNFYEHANPNWREDPFSAINYPSPPGDASRSQEFLQSIGRQSVAFPAAGGAVKEAAQGIRAYHGSPHDFDKFSLDAMGTGHGNQAFGSGLYFSENEGIAKTYRDRVSNGRPIKGHMYEVNINASPDDFLDWDKPMAQQRDHLKDAFYSVMPPHESPNSAYGHVLPRAVMDDVSQAMGLHPASAEAKTGPPRVLSEKGIAGISYLDKGKAGGEPSRNYVAFDASLIEILRKYGLLPPAALGAAASQDPAQQ